MREIAQIESLMSAVASVSAAALISGLGRGFDEADRERLAGWIRYYAALATQEAGRADAAEAELHEARAKLRFAELQMHLLQEELDDRDLQARDDTHRLLAAVRDRTD